MKNRIDQTETGSAQSARSDINEVKMKSAMSRRSFVSLGGLATVTAAGLGLAACAPAKNAPTSGKSSSKDSSANTSSNSFTAPDPIAESDIASEEEADIVVVGAGTAGLVCALTAAQQGASVIVIAKDDSPSAQGGSNFAIGSKLTKKLGVDFDVFQAIRHSLQTQTYRVSEGQWCIFARESGKAMDWLIDIAEAHGLGVTLEQPTIGLAGIAAEYPGSHVFYGGPQDQPFGDQPDVLAAIAEELTKTCGQKLTFNMTAKQLVRNSNGPVTGVIAQNADGAYTRYNAKKGVVLATGDYANNSELVDKYNPMIAGIPSMKMPANNTGDGHLMAMWVGAAMQRNPEHGAMIFGTTSYRGLNVNSEGKRFMNEYQANGYTGIQALQQQEDCFYQVWDSNFADSWQDLGLKWDVPKSTPDEMRAAFEAGVADGTIFKADTVEELAKKIDAPADQLAKTVERYNTVVAQGNDEDFLKEPEFLFPVSTAPFYAQKVTANLLISLGGLDVTDEMQVRSTEGSEIEGLYALGATAGNFYGGPYTTYFAGINMGRNVCFGHLLGKKLASL